MDKVPKVYDLYAMAHTGSYKKVKAFSQSDLDDANNFTNISSHNKLVRYRDEGKARKGEDFNPSQHPIDPELVMIAGGGRPLDSHWRWTYTVLSHSPGDQGTPNELLS